MEYLPKGYTLSLAEGAFPLSTDSMVLAHFVRLSKADRVLDLGSGCGTLGLLLCAAWDQCHVTGVELEQTGHEAALDNIRRNGLSGRMESICADLRTVPSRFSPGSFSVCVSNPPYFSVGPASSKTPLARREDCCTPDDLFRAAAWALKYGGEFFLVHRPERLAELIAKAAVHALEAKHLRLVRHRGDGPISLILLRFRKGGKPGLHIDEISLHDPQGNPTEAWREIYHKDHS